MYNINIVLISPINQLKIIRYYFKVVICQFWFYPDFMNRTYTILISSAYRLYLFMNRHILFWYRPQTVNSDYIPILKSIYNRAYTIPILSAYRLYLFKNQHSDSFGKKNIRFLSIRAIKSPQNRQKTDINSQKSPRIFENKLYDYEAIFLHLTCVKERISETSSTTMPNFT